MLSVTARGRLPQASVMLMGRGVMEWSRERDRVINVSAGQPQSYTLTWLYSHTAPLCVECRGASASSTSQVMLLSGVPTAVQARWWRAWMAICTAMQIQCGSLQLLPGHHCPCIIASPWIARELLSDSSLLLAIWRHLGGQRALKRFIA